MNLIKFKTKIKNGSIKLPAKYKSLENSEVNVAINSIESISKRKIKVINPYKVLPDSKKLSEIKKVTDWVKDERNEWKD
jgi:pyruvate-formate lyase-activating enzyme